MDVFDYRCVDEDLITDVADNVQHGENSVLLAPPCGGKKCALQALSKRLRQTGTTIPSGAKAHVPFAELDVRDEARTLQSCPIPTVEML